MNLQKPTLIKSSILISIASILCIAGAYWLINFQPGLIPQPLLELARQTDIIDNPKSETCSECHQVIFDAWKKSRHSQAWVSEFYIKDSEDRTKEKCLPCHIPAIVNPGSKPEPRLGHRDEGIFCAPCHLKEGAIRGPYDLLAPPHPTRQVADYRKSLFCGSCHETTYKEWQETNEETPCQSCHMPSSEGRLTQKFPLNLLHKKRKVADHSFPHGEFSEKDIDVTVEFKERGVILTLQNQTIPHHLPTADNGDPRLFVYSDFFDSKGETIDSFKEIVSPQLKTALPFKEQVRYHYFVSNASAATVRVEYKPAWSKEKQLVFSRSFSEDGSNG